MSLPKCLALTAAALALGLALGFWVARALSLGRVEREVEVVTEARTVVVRERVESQREEQATERFTLRRLAVPCPPCARTAHSAPGATLTRPCDIGVSGPPADILARGCDIHGQTAAKAPAASLTEVGDADEAGAMGFSRFAILEERVVERALSRSEKLRFDSDFARAESASTHRENEVATAPEPPRWRLGALAGWSWRDSEPVFGLTAAARVLGPLELGAWAIASRDLQGAAGLSVGLRF